MSESEVEACVKEAKGEDEYQIMIVSAMTKITNKPYVELQSYNGYLNP